MNPADLLGAMKRTVEQLAAFNDIAKALTSTLEVGEVLQLVMQKVTELLKPSNWSLLLMDEATGRLYFEVAVGEGAERLKTLTLAPGEGIAGGVYELSEPRLVHDVREDPTFARRFDLTTDFHTRSVLAVPLRSKGRVLGVIELVNGRNDPRFSFEDLQALTGMADYVAIAIENARNFKRVQELTLTDEHTGVYNARHLRASLDQEVKRASRFAHPLSLIFLDLDHFKRVNDTHGHLVGSAVLKETAEVLTRTVRGVDSVFRYGGDEFAVLLIETDLSGSRKIGERVRDALREQVFQEKQGLALRLTASLGIATYPDHGTHALGLLEAADRAMYRVKALGRNGVLSAGDTATSDRVA